MKKKRVNTQFVANFSRVTLRKRRKKHGDSGGHSFRNASTQLQWSAPINSVGYSNGSVDDPDKPSIFINKFAGKREKPFPVLFARLIYIHRLERCRDRSTRNICYVAPSKHATRKRERRSLTARHNRHSIS